MKDSKKLSNHISQLESQYKSKFQKQHGFNSQINYEKSNTKINKHNMKNCHSIGPIALSSPSSVFLKSQDQDFIFLYLGRRDDNDIISLNFIEDYYTPKLYTEMKNKRLTNHYTPEKLSDYENTDILLGEGHFGKAEVFCHKDTKSVFAFKVLKKSKFKEYRHFESLLNEVRILKSLNHPFIVKVYNTFHDKNHLYLKMEYAEGGDLMKFLKTESIYSEKWIIFILAQVVLSLEYLHSRNIVYRDIKPENILLTSNGYIKMADFGLSKDLTSTNDTTKTFCGTPEFMSPEILRGEEYGLSVDMWSFGVLMYEIYFGKVNILNYSSLLCIY